MRLLEVHQLETLCREIGPSKIEAVLIPWDDQGAHTLMMKKGNDNWIVRIKHHNRARVFKTVTPALLICKRCGLSSVTIKLEREN
jgi:hypothetical protein